MKLPDNVKQNLKIFIDSFRMPIEFYLDYRNYKRWNYHNKKVATRNAADARILRQTHILEKGMSLSKPRMGFGQKKIDELFDMLEQYQKSKYPIDGFAFQNAIAVLNAYVIEQAKMGYKNEDLNKKLEEFECIRNRKVISGINIESRKEIMRQAHSEFPDFLLCRHSIRQFSDTSVDFDTVKKAVELAQRAPTACNRQASKVYFYDDKEVNDEIGQLIMGNTGFEHEVKNYLIVTADVSAFYDTFERNQLYIEAGLFSMALVEALHYYGIASCILQNGEYYKQNRRFKRICRNIPENERIALFIAIGNYREEFSYAKSNRKSVEDVLIRN